MPKPRNKENKGLPKRWQHTHGAYYYQVPPGLEAGWDGKKKIPARRIAARGLQGMGVADGMPG
ncbi:hypothetical protein ACFS07_13105 [Undibacterium arcticum]